MYRVCDTHFRGIDIKDYYKSGVHVSQDMCTHAFIEWMQESMCYRLLAREKAQIVQHLLEEKAEVGLSVEGVDSLGAAIENRNLYWHKSELAQQYAFEWLDFGEIKLHPKDYYTQGGMFDEREMV